MHTIISATTEHESAWRSLWAGYCSFYEAEVPDAITAATWARIIQGTIGCRLALVNSQPAGFYHVVRHEGTWVDKPIGYLEDLFVASSARGTGLGKALLNDLLATAKAEGWSRVYWHTHKTNHHAQKLYNQYVQADDFIRYRINF
jgi:GNAT superfamily N-acetyltransferase